MPPVTLPYKDPRKTERVSTKPRFLDVYSKYVNKNGLETKKSAKVAEQKPLGSEKLIKT
jgi:hypothetical protein